MWRVRTVVPEIPGVEHLRRRPPGDRARSCCTGCPSLAASRRRRARCVCSVAPRRASRSVDRGRSPRRRDGPRRARAGSDTGRRRSLQGRSGSTAGSARRWSGDPSARDATFSRASATGPSSAATRWMQTSPSGAVPGRQVPAVSCAVEPSAAGARHRSRVCPPRDEGGGARAKDRGTRRAERPTQSHRSPNEDVVLTTERLPGRQPHSIGSPKKRARFVISGPLPMATIGETLNALFRGRTRGARRTTRSSAERGTRSSSLSTVPRPRRGAEAGGRGRGERPARSHRALRSAISKGTPLSISSSTSSAASHPRRASRPARRSKASLSIASRRSRSASSARSHACRAATRPSPSCRSSSQRWASPAAPSSSGVSSRTSDAEVVAASIEALAELGDPAARSPSLPSSNATDGRFSSMMMRGGERVSIADLAHESARNPRGDG